MDDGGCPCGRGVAFASCCEPIHVGGAGLGTTAEQLMRARYTAYAIGAVPFLLDSWHPLTRPESITIDPGVTWLGLEIVETDAGTAFDAEGIVEFMARFDRRGELLELHERSSFVKLDGRWVYIDGE